MKTAAQSQNPNSRWRRERPSGGFALCARLSVDSHLIVGSEDQSYTAVVRLNDMLIKTIGLSQSYK